MKKKPTVKTIYVLATTVNHETVMLEQTSHKRQSDQKYIPAFTTDIKRAREFDDEQAAVDFIGQLVTNGRIYHPEPKTVIPDKDGFASKIADIH